MNPPGKKVPGTQKVPGTFFFDRAYLPKLVSLLGEAQRTIEARIFLMDPGIPRPSPLEKIFEALRKAKRRGVEVTLETAGIFKHKPSGKRLKAFAAQFGIPLRWQTGGFLHEKSAVIDDKIQLVGSHNWSPASLLSNREATLLVKKGAPVLNASEFRRELLEKIRNARKEITIATYDMEEIAGTDFDFADEVTRQLIFARMKNRKVRVLLDASLAARPGTEGSDVVLYRGRKKAEEMSRGKVHVYYDATQALFHVKAAVIDGEWVFTGSQNINPVRDGEIEKTVLVRSPRLAGQLKHYLAAALGTSQRFRYDPLEISGVRIPLDWVRRGGVIARIFQARGKRTLDLLLALLHEAERLGSAEIPWEVERLAELSGIRAQDDGRMERKRSLQRILTQPRIFLKRDYRLLRYQGRPLQPLETVTLLDRSSKIVQSLPHPNPLPPPGGEGEDPKRQGEGGSGKNRGPSPQKRWTGPYFVLPWEYWTKGWHRRLNAGERYAYFIHLAAASQSPEAPLWSLKLSEIKKRYGISRQQFAKNTVRLERLNLIEVDRDPKIVLKDVFKRPNRYRVNALWSEEEEALGLERMKEEFMAKEEEFEEARRLAGRLNQPHDLEVIRKFLVLVERHGIEKVRKAAAITARFKHHFALRNVHHTAGILRNWAAGIVR